jgi:excisionase family DNA binding protein
MLDRPKFLSIGQAAAYLSLSVGAVRRMQKAGKSPKYYEIGNAYKFLKEDLDTWLESRKK